MKKPIGLFTLILLAFFFSADSASTSYHFSDFRARPPIHIFKITAAPQGLSPGKLGIIHHRLPFRSSLPK